jgi:hypothetical protein
MRKGGLVINDKFLIPLYEKFDAMERLHATAVRELEGMRACCFQQIRDYNALVEQRDNLVEEVAFIRREVGEAKWAAMVDKYERENESVRFALTFGRKGEA